MATSSVDQLAIFVLIERRRRELALSRAAVVGRAGYKNIRKGIRRLDELLEGDLEKTKSLLTGLPAALDLPLQAIVEAVERTKSQLELREREARAQADGEWRANFRPHVCILTERTIPQPIFIAAFCRTDQLLHIEIGIPGNAKAYRVQALASVKARIAEVNGVFPGFGKPIGFVLNYSPDFAVRFDLAGNAKETLTSAYRLNQASVFLKGGRANSVSFSGPQGSAAFVHDTQK